MQKFRLFIGIELPDRLKEKIFNLGKEFRSLVKANFVSEENLHISLQFLGYVNESKLEQIKESLSSIEYRSFPVEVKNFGAFPSKKNLRVIWAGIENNIHLSNLQNKISKSMKEIGFKPDEREYRPHITIARVKYVEDSQKLQQLISAKQEFGSFVVERFHLFESKLYRSGPIYLKVFSFSL